MGKADKLSLDIECVTFQNEISKLPIRTRVAKVRPARAKSVYGVMYMLLYGIGHVYVAHCFQKVLTQKAQNFSICTREPKNPVLEDRYNDYTIDMEYRCPS